MKLPTWLAKVFRAGSDEPAAHFVYIKLPEGLMPIARGDKYEDPLEASLRELSLGEITGGGSQLGEPNPDGTATIEFCGIDVELTQLDQGRGLLRRRLVELGALPGTELHFTVDNTLLQDELQPDGWVLDRPRTFRHPGLGI